MSADLDVMPDEDAISDHRTPQDIVAEQSVLGSAMLNAGMMGEILATGLAARDFYLPKHELIWQAICALDADGRPLDAVTVYAEVKRRGDVGRVGDFTVIHTLTATPPTAKNGAEYARIVVGKAVLRRLMQAGFQIANVAQGEAGTVDEAISAAESLLGAVGSDAAPLSINAADAIDAILARKDEGPLETARGWRTGYTDVDKIVLPMQAQQFAIVAARPSVGKSVCLRDMGRHMAIRQGARVLFHSMEMSTDEVSTSLIAAEASVLLNNLKDESVQLDEREKARVADAYARYAGAYFHLDEREAISLQQLRASIRRHKPDVVFVDYAQLGVSGRRTESRYMEMSEVARGLKNLAKAEKVLLIAAAQLTRDAANRKPTLVDLKESGEFEQAADTIIFIHREDMLEKETVRAGEADFIVAKQRGGPRNDATLASQLHFSRFVDMAS